MPKPGPGTYNIRTSIGQGPSKSIGQRIDLKTNSDSVPGPGSYNLPGAIGTTRQHQYTMRGRTKLHAQGLDSPGPCAYSVREQSPSKAFSLTNRPKDLQSTISYPGPGHYHNTGEILSSAPPSYTMRGRPTTPPSKLITPGPGAYEMKPSRSDKAVSLKSRHMPKPDTSSPGPGAYEIRARTSGPSFTMRSRTALPKEDD